MATREFAARTFISSLFVIFALRIATEFMRTGHITGLLLLVSELLVMFIEMLPAGPSPCQ